MAQIDSLFQFLISQGGHELLVPADDNCQVVDAAGSHPLNRVMSAREVADLIQEVLSGPAAQAWASHEPVELVRRAETGHFRIRAEWREEGPRLSLLRTPLDYVERLARLAVDAGASEVLLSEGAPPFIRREGTLERLTDAEALPPGLLREYLGPASGRFLVDLQGVGRARAARIGRESEPTVVLRFLPEAATPPTDLPGSFREALGQRSGLILAATPDGQGLSGLLAGLLSLVADGPSMHIVSIEELPEVPVPSGKALLTRWTLGPDAGRPEAIRAAMTVHPEVLFVDEVVCAATLLACLDAARAGTLVVAGCRGATVAGALSGLMGLFPPGERTEPCERLAGGLRGAVAQVLCRGTEGKRIPVREVLLSMPGSAEAIRAGRLDEVEEGIRAVGFSLDDMLVRLVTEGKVPLPAAEAVSVDRKRLREEIAMRARRETARP